jgi:hypothetical protein
MRLLTVIVELAYAQRDYAAAVTPSRPQAPSVPSRSGMVDRSASSLPPTVEPDAASSLPLMPDPDAASSSRYDFDPLDDDSDLEEISLEAFTVSKKPTTRKPNEFEEISAQLFTEARQRSKTGRKLLTDDDDKLSALSRRASKQEVPFSTQSFSGAAIYNAAEYEDDTALPDMSPYEMPSLLDDTISQPPDTETYTPPGSPLPSSLPSPIPSSPSRDVYLHQPPPQTMSLLQLHAELAATQQREDLIWNAILRQLAVLGSLPRDSVPRPKGWRSERREAEYKEEMLQSALELQGERRRVLEGEIGRR